MNRPQSFDQKTLNSVKNKISSVLGLGNPDVMMAEISFVGVEDSSRAIFEIPRWVDTEIEAGVSSRLNSGSINMMGRSTWGSLKLNEQTHYPTFIAAFGTPTSSIVFVGVFKSLWTNAQAIEWLHSTLESSSAAGRNTAGLPNIFILPSVMLWDAKRELLPRMLGYTFTGCLASNGALSRVYWPLNSFVKSGIFAVDRRHSDEAAGTLHLTEYEGGFLNPSSENGGWLTR